MKTETQSMTSADIDWLHNEFILFGNPKAPYWFLGLEEGDHPVKDQPIDEFIQRLIRKTKKHSRSEMISLRDLIEPDNDYPFLPQIDGSGPRSASGVKYQSTWGGYIKLLLSIESARTGKEWNLNDVKIYQKYRLGAIDLEDDFLGSCLLELFPMARKGRKGAQWPYAKLAHRPQLDYFDKAKNYKNKVEGMRTKKVLELLNKHQPKVLFIFGGDCREAILNELKDKPAIHQVGTGKKTLAMSSMKHGNTLLVFSNHPTSHGISNEYWRNLGKQVVEL